MASSIIHTPVAARPLPGGPGGPGSPIMPGGPGRP